MSKSIRLGVLVPSSNTALEPLTQAIISGIPNVTVHFSRFPVTTIGLDKQALDQFRYEHILSAAQLLVDARVDIIGWSGTSAGWLGFENDEGLCRVIRDATNVPVTTSILALNKALKILKIQKLGLVTPYQDDVQAVIIKNYATIGIDCSTESHLSIVDNLSIGEVDEGTLGTQVAHVVKAGSVQGVTIFCTNLRAADRVACWEELYGVPVLDTVATVVWDMLRSVGVNTTSLKGWGRLFQLE